MNLDFQKLNWSGEKDWSETEAASQPRPGGMVKKYFLYTFNKGEIINYLL